MVILHNYTIHLLWKIIKEENYIESTLKTYHKYAIVVHLQTILHIHHDCSTSILELHSGRVKLEHYRKTVQFIKIITKYTLVKLNIVILTVIRIREFNVSMMDGLIVISMIMVMRMMMRMRIIRVVVMY
jgi:hypothetical protein